MRIWQAHSADGTKLHVRDFGPESAPPIVLVHGWSQCHLSWKKQLASDLAQDYRLIAFDLRGHGMSDVPLEDEAYTRTQPWADDVHAVLEQSGVRAPLLVGWSHGSFVVADYLRVHGESALSGVALMSWAVKTGHTAEERAYIGKRLEELGPGSVSEDLTERIAALRLFVRDMVERPLSLADHEEALCYNISVPTHVRRATGAHDPVDNADVLSSLTVPYWNSHGASDLIVRPESQDLVRAAAPTATITTYPGVGHAPMLEIPDEFNADLRRFAERVFSASSAAQQ